MAEPESTDPRGAEASTDHRWIQAERSFTGDPDRRSPKHVRDRLRALANRRVDIDNPAAKERLIAGGYRSRGLLADALLIALVETGIAVRVEGSKLVADEEGMAAEEAIAIVASILEGSGEHTH